MSVGKRIITKAILVLQEDSAVDHDKSDYAAYRASYDLTKLAFLPDQKPTRFHIAALTGEQKIHFSGLEGVNARVMFLVRAGLRQIENYIVVRDGERLTLPPIVFEEVGGLGKLVSSQWITDADLMTTDLLMIAEAINNITEVRAPLS